MKVEIRMSKQRQTEITMVIERRTTMVNKKMDHRKEWKRRKCHQLLEVITRMRKVLLKLKSH